MELKNFAFGYDPFPTGSWKNCWLIPGTGNFPGGRMEGLVQAIIKEGELYVADL
ncbi:hypothetical protein [Desulfofundulus thermobenzoicus]|uniref:hypothetical protein n=1 Tax=Desulfofundulus thermobenzoicus TaxID=29376 RepID=UPI00128F0D5C|nr:hypothetical protein [Desulfofundulus thermobenzoicus]